MTLEDFYTLLKSKLTGQVINGSVVSVITEAELDLIYEQIKEGE